MSNLNNIRLDELPPEHPLRATPFSTPEGYFDDLPSRVQARIVPKAKPAFRISWSWQRTVASLAGSSLIALLVWQTLPQRQESIGNESLAGVSDDVIVAYLDEQGVSVDEIADFQQLHSSLGSDTTAIQFLNVTPKEIQQLINEQSLVNYADRDS